MAVKTTRILFYHVPKTGGAWVKAAMRASGLRISHCNGIDKRHPFDLRNRHAAPAVVPDRYKDRFAFCFVRHPASWYRSFWAYRFKSRRFNRRFPLDRYWDEDFEAFVGRVLEVFPGGFVSALYRHYVDDVDFVGLQERLADDLVEALVRAGETFDEAALRATPPQNVVAGLVEYGRLCSSGPDLAARITETERWTMERFYE